MIKKCSVLIFSLLAFSVATFGQQEDTLHVLNTYPIRGCVKNEGSLPVDFQARASIIVRDVNLGDFVSDFRAYDSRREVLSVAPGESVEVDFDSFYVDTYFTSYPVPCTCYIYACFLGDTLLANDIASKPMVMVRSKGEAGGASGEPVVARVNLDMARQVKALGREVAGIRDEDCHLSEKGSTTSLTPYDTVGSTIYDWGVNAPMIPHIKIHPGDNGVHLIWRHSQMDDFSDLRMWYNAYNPSVGEWNATGMNAGISIYEAGKNSHGVLAIDAANIPWVAFTVYGTPNHLAVAYDIEPYLGAFSTIDVPNPSDGAVIWPRIAIDVAGRIHLLGTINDGANFPVYYTCSKDEGASWDTWKKVAPKVGFPSSSLGASLRDNSFCIAWSIADNAAPDYSHLYYWEGDSIPGTITPIDITPDSTDLIPEPGAWILSGYPFYDRDGNLHIATQFSHDEIVLPAEIWDYCPTRDPKWGLVSQYPFSPIQGRTGYNAICACRPSLGQDPVKGYLYCVWEEFVYNDTSSATGEPRMNADIFAARSMDNGITWGQSINITMARGIHDRFPCIGDIVNDTVHIVYQKDLINGFYVQGESGKSTNPIICRNVPVIEGDVSALSIGVGVEENIPVSHKLNLLVSPNPFLRFTTISYTVPQTSKVSLGIYDAAGRLVRKLVDETQTPGEKTLTCDNLPSSGIYFCKLTVGDRTISEKVIFVR